MTINIKDFYLHTPMLRYKYMRLKSEDLPEDFIEEYKLRDKVTKDGYVYVKVRKRNIWIIAVRNTGTRAVGKKIKRKGVQAKQTHPRFLDARLASNLFQPCS